MRLPRRRRLDRAVPLVLTAVLALAASRAHADPLYTITNLGQRSADGLNNLGDVVGNVGSPSVGISDENPSVFASGDPYIYHSSGPDAGTFTDLSSVLGGSTYLNSINDSGQMAGDVQSPQSGTQGFIYSNGQLTVIPIPAGAGGTFSDAHAMNNSGAVVGVLGNGDGFLYQNGQTTEVGPRVATAISDNGIVAGSGFVYQNGQMTYINAGIAAYSSGVNNAGQVAGSFNVSGDIYHAFLYQNGKVADLGTLGGPSSWASAINSQGQIVGYSEIAGGSANSYHAFLSQNGSMIDLNSLIPTSSGWTLEEAQAINDKGQIIGYGIGPDGQVDSFLLTPAGDGFPTPEPSTLAFFALAAVGVALRGVWRHR